MPACKVCGSWFAKIRDDEVLCDRCQTALGRLNSYVSPVVHGRWEEVDWIEMDGGGNYFIRTPNAALRCSSCCNCFKKELLWKDSFCPNCGAKMDGEQL